MKFVIVDTGQYTYGANKIFPKYIDKLKDKYKLETIKINEYNKEVEYTIVTINNIFSLVELQKHKPLGWIKDTSTICNIINIQKTGIFIYDGIANRYLNFINVFNLKFADGTPFGIKE